MEIIWPGMGMDELYPWRMEYCGRGGDHASVRGVTIVTQQPRVKYSRDPALIIPTRF